MCVGEWVGVLCVCVCVCVCARVIRDTSANLWCLYAGVPRPLGATVSSWGSWRD